MSNLLYSRNTIQSGPSFVPAVTASHLIGAVLGTYIDGSVSLTVTHSGVYSLVTPRPTDPTLDLWYDCGGTSSQGKPLQGKLIATTSMLGVWASITINVGLNIPTLSTSVLANYVEGAGSDGLLTLTISVYPTGFVPFTTAVSSTSYSVSSPFANWVRWTKIGSLDFTEDRNQEAGRRPLDWSGYIYCLKKLTNKIVVYGENGVSLLTPSGTSYGLQTIHKAGIKGKHAVTGNDVKHFFIDNKNQLWELSERLQVLDYSEYLNTLCRNVVMSFDDVENLVYICDGVNGFVFNAKDRSLGEGPSNISGLGYRDGTIFAVAPATISFAAFEICTDIYDLGYRSGKTVFRLEFGTDVSTILYAAVDYRRDKSSEFIQTPWYEVNDAGRVTVIAWGREFRIRAKAAGYEQFDIDYIKVEGVLDAH